jgi:uncharacterized protein
MASRSQSSLDMAAAKEALVRRMVDALQRADGAAVGELLKGDVVYHFPGRSEFAGTWRGKGRVMSLFGGLGRLLEGSLRLTNHDVVASEAHVVELSTHSAALGGRPHEWNVARVYHVDEHHITEVWLMIEDVQAFDEWLGTNSPGK